MSKSIVNVFCQIWALQDLAGAGDHRPHDFLAGGVAQGVDDAVMAVAAFAAEQQIAVFLVIEHRAPFDQLADVTRRFADHHLDDFAIAQIGARDERVGRRDLQNDLRARARRRCRPGRRRCWIRSR